MLLRIDDQDPSTARTLQGCAQAVSELAALGLLAMVEPLPYRRHDDGSLVLRKDAPALARAVTIASGLGRTSAHTWLNRRLAAVSAADPHYYAARPPGRP